jgi:hypothetical protein
MVDCTYALGLLSTTTTVNWEKAAYCSGYSYPSHPVLTRSNPVLTSLTPVSRIFTYITHTHPNSETDANLRSRAL